MANVSFNSKTIEKNGSEVIFSASFYSSTKTELETYINLTYPIGKQTSDLGTIQKLNYREDGTFWYCDVSGTMKQSNEGIDYNIANSGPTDHSLNTVCIPLPLNAHASYRTHWNHFLWCSSSNAAKSPPESVKNAVSNSSVLSGENVWMWTDDGTPPEAGIYMGVNVQNWYAGADGSTLYPSKPGAETFDYYTYQITESGEFNTEKAAYWVVKKVLNKPINAPMLGNFGIAGGNWKLENAQITPNGKKFYASLTWTWAEDKWDSDIYPPTLKNKVR